MSGGAARPGASLVEVMVAVVLLCVGAMAAAATSLLAARVLHDAEAREAAALLAASTIDSLRAQPGAGSGMRPAGGDTLHWRRTVQGRDVFIELWVDYRSPLGHGREAFGARLALPPPAAPDYD